MDALSCQPVCDLSASTFLPDTIPEFLASDIQPHPGHDQLVVDHSCWEQGHPEELAHHDNNLRYGPIGQLDKISKSDRDDYSNPAPSIIQVLAIRQCSDSFSHCFIIIRNAPNAGIIMAMIHGHIRILEDPAARSLLVWTIEIYQ